MSDSTLERKLLSVAEEQFAAACRQLTPIARINAAAVVSVLEADVFDHNDPEEAHYAAQAVAFGFAQLVHLHRSLVLLAIDYEHLSATGVSLAERG